MPPEAEPAISTLKARIPNALTLARVFLAIGMFVILTVVVEPPTDDAGSTSQAGALLFAAGFFVLAAITDALDGYFARRWQVVSLFGRVMDPFADKLLVLGSFVFLAGPAFVSPDGIARAGFEPWMVVLILARELLVTTLRGVYERAGVDFSATASGKIKMILQSIAVPLILVVLAFDPAGSGSTARYAILAITWSVVIVTIWSGAPYLIRAGKARTAMENERT